MARWRRTTIPISVAVSLITGFTGFGAAPLSPGLTAIDSAVTDLSSPVKINNYLISMGVDPSTVIFQTGARNYAGPACPGESWDCVPADSPIVQMASAGENKFECTPESLGTDPDTNTCMIVQVTASGDNNAHCHLKDSEEPLAEQTCDITQTTDSGNNRAFVTQMIQQHGGPSQEAKQKAEVTQLVNDSGKNFSHIHQQIDQDTKVSSDSTTDISQNQLAIQRATVDQDVGTMIVDPGVGDNFSFIKQSESQSADAKGGANVVQDQNADAGELCEEPLQAPHICASIEQTLTTDTGKNDSNTDQSIRHKAHSHGASGDVDQTQGEPVGTGGIEVNLQQSDEGHSTASKKQKQDHDASAKDFGGTATLDQTDPDRIIIIGFSPDSAVMDQVSIQMAKGGNVNQDSELVIECEANESCKGNQKVTQNGQTHTASCPGGPDCFLVTNCNAGGFEGEPQMCETTEGEDGGVD